MSFHFFSGHLVRLNRWEDAFEQNAAVQSVHGLPREFPAGFVRVNQERRGVEMLPRPATETRRLQCPNRIVLNTPPE